MADGIRALVENAQQVSSTQAVINDVCARIMGEVSEAYSRGRRMPPDALRGLFETLDDVVMNSLQIVDCRLRETPATAIHPKGAAIDVSYVGVRKKLECEGFDDLFELFTLRVVLKSKIVTMHLHPHPIAFQYHAAERLVERVDGQSMPFEMIAAELAEWSLALWEVWRVSEGQPDLRLSLPCLNGEGMLAGQYVDLPASPIVRRTINKIGRFGNAAGRVGDRHTIFVAKTFVGSATLRPDQIAAMNKLARWRLLNKTAYKSAREESLFDVLFPDEGYDVPGLGEVPRDALRKILGDREFQNAMTTKTLEAADRSRIPNIDFSVSAAQKAATALAQRGGWLPPAATALGMEGRAM
jgi:hypothetical protein